MPDENNIPAPAEATPAMPAENGGVTPAGDSGTAQPTENAPAATPGAAQQEPTANSELYELPDGRKVDAQTLATEWKEKFMPEFTRRSQALSNYERGQQQQTSQQQPIQQTAPNSNPEQPVAPWREQGWIPNSYNEIIEAAKWEIKAEVAQEQQVLEQARKQVNDMVEQQLTEIRKMEPNVSEELLFQHASKYGFSDLRVAFKNMQDFNIAVKRTEQRVQQNLQSRANEPIAVQTNPPTTGNEIDYNSVTNDNRSVLDVLRSVKG